MQRGEDLIGVLAGALLALRTGTEPEPRGLGLQPCCATPSSVAQPVNERMLDREDAPLSARRRRCETPCLGDERVFEVAEVGLDGRHLHLEILTQAAERHSRSSCLVCSASGRRPYPAAPTPPA